MSGKINSQNIVLAGLVPILVAAACWAAQPYRPLHPDPVLEPWRWQAFPELKGSGLRCLVEARDGAVWFGTDKGTRRYDGLHWTMYTPEDGLLGAPVNVLCATREGRVYAGSDRGISHFSEGTWSRVFPPQGDLSWPIDQILQAADGSIWAATAWGALRLDGEDSRLYTTEAMGAVLRVQAPYVQLSIVPDEVVPERSWYEGTGIKVVKGGYLGIPRSSIPMVIWALAPGGPGEVVGLKVGDRVLTMDGKVPNLPHLTLNGPGSPVTLIVQRQNQPEPFEVIVTRGQAEGHFSGFSISGIHEDREGRMWFGLSWGGEIIRFDSRDPEAWQLYTADDGLGPGDRPKIIQTRDGSIWTISNHFVGGVNRFDGQTWTHTRLSAVQGSDINTAILETRDGTLWIGGHQGTLSAFRDTTWTSWSPPDVPFTQARIAGLLETSDGALWFAGLGQEVTRLEYGTSRWTTYEDLNFQCETPDGALWFISRTKGNRNRSVVRYNQSTGEWTRYGVEDGLMQTPAALLATRQGEVWVTGSHEEAAATARFDGRQWSRRTHPRFSQNIDWRAVYESLDGTLWFGASVGWSSELGHLGGVLQFDPAAPTEEEAWIHHTPPEAPLYAYCMGQTTDGVLWVGGGGLRYFDGRKWSTVTEPKGLTSWVQGIWGTQDGGLWVGTRAYGLFFYNGREWNQYGVQDGLANSRINSIIQTDDGSLWVETDKGMSRFDGRTWTTQALPEALVGQRVSLQQSQDGALWFHDIVLDKNSSSLWTIRYEPETDPPPTRITLSLDKVSQPGNTTLAWKGTDAWQATLEENLHYAWRLDEGEWSPFSPEKNKVFLSLPSGEHTFEVKARDRDFNEDSTPAVVRFTVVPPVWREPWFVGLMVGLFCAIGIQTGRVIRRDRSLQETNRGLQEKTENLEIANQKQDESNRALHQRTRDLQEANLQIQEANRLKSQFLANMSHELRTPLNAILGFTQLMIRDQQFAPEQRENLEVIGRSGEYLLTLINDVLEMSKIEAGQTELNEENFDLYRLLGGLEDMLRLRAEDKGLELVFDRTADVPQHVRADESKLRQVLTNLLGNGIKFTQEGSVVLRAGYSGEDAEPRLFFEVEDTGPGIAPEELETMFDAFVQTATGLQAQEGTGLGLPISQQFVHLMGGEIIVRSQVGRGSIFAFDIHISLVEAGEIEARGPVRRVVGLEPDQPTYRILVVEDRLESRKLLVKLLEPLGFEVREAVDGQEGIEVWEEWEPHLIWMDMRMPVMNGHEATKQIKATVKGQATVIIALTASAFEEQRGLILSAGCDGFVRKPFQEEEIFDAMAQHLGVRFAYEDQVQPDLLQAEASPRAALTPDTFSVLPDAWVAELYHAATQADAELSFSLIEQLDEEHAGLAQSLLDLVHDFRFDKIMSLTNLNMDRDV